MQKENYVYINGRFYEKSEAVVSVFDHGLLYGDGVFEGIREYSGVVFQLREHVDRLYDSAKYIRLDIPLSKKEMIDAIVKTLRKNNLKDSYIRVVVTRGIGDLGVDPLSCKEPNIIIIAEQMESLLGSKIPKVIRVMISSVRRDRVDATSHEVKSLNYLNSILAKIEANEHGFDDAIILDSMGFVSEASVTNVFIVKDGKISTPPTSSGILHGITRNRVIRLCREEGFEVEEREITPFELISSDEIFLTGTKSEIVSIGYINSIKIGKEAPGEITRKLYSAFREIVKRREEGIPVFEETLSLNQE